MVTTGKGLVLLIDAKPERRGRMAKSLRKAGVVVHEIAAPAFADGKITELEPGIVAIGCGEDIFGTLEVCRSLAANHSATRLFVFDDKMTATVALRLMENGASEAGRTNEVRGRIPAILTQTAIPLSQHKGKADDSNHDAARTTARIGAGGTVRGHKRTRMPLPLTPKPSPRHDASQSATEPIGVMYLKLASGELANAIQFLCMSPRTGELRLDCPKSKARGSLYLKGGAVVHATFADKHGVPAFSLLLGEPEIEARFLEGRRPPAQTIDMSTDNLLLEASVLADEMLAKAEAM